ncbi:hypothetical protein JOB18_039091 [Solea senegalensis]|uniref:Uncharacterized protein n=1 Tax=Solea senegalensis TaxID=28829 RepID=A0AAV6PJ65_SOLSE|nr:hypothetical protein JOB18_039091 [Solea senegalensis]
MPPKASNHTTEEYVTMAQVRELLDQQKDFYRTLLEQQKKSFKTCVQIIVDSSNRRTDDLSKQVYDLQVSLEMTQKDFDDFKISCKPWSKNCMETRTDLDTICKSMISISDKTEYLEGQSRRQNVVVNGIKGSGNEKVSESEEKVRKLQLDHLKIELDWAHRTGKPMALSEKPRPIVVRFLRLKDKLAVLDKAKNLKGSGIFINKVFP